MDSHPRLACLSTVPFGHLRFSADVIKNTIKEFTISFMISRIPHYLHVCVTEMKLATEIVNVVSIRKTEFRVNFYFGISYNEHRNVSIVCNKSCR